MKVFLTAILITLLSTQAHAQGAAGKQRPSGNGNTPKADESAKRHAAEEAAAKDALSKIPDSKEKYDPWKIAR